MAYTTIDDPSAHFQQLYILVIKLLEQDLLMMVIQIYNQIFLGLK